MRKGFFSTNFGKNHLNDAINAEYRIEESDGKIVHFWYEDHQTGKRVDETLPVYPFLIYIFIDV